MSKASGIGLVIVSVITAAPSQTPPAPYWILELKFVILNAAPSGVLNTPFPHSHKCFCCPNQNFPEEDGRCLPFKLSAWLIQQLPKSGQGKYVAKTALAPSALSQSLRWELPAPDTWQSRATSQGTRLGQAAKHHEEETFPFVMGNGLTTSQPKAGLSPASAGPCVKWQCISGRTSLSCGEWQQMEAFSFKEKRSLSTAQDAVPHPLSLSSWNVGKSSEAFRPL